MARAMLSEIIGTHMICLIQIVSASLSFLRFEVSPASPSARGAVDAEGNFLTSCWTSCLVSSMAQVRKISRSSRTAAFTQAPINDWNEKRADRKSPSIM